MSDKSALVLPLASISNDDVEIAGIVGTQLASMHKENLPIVPGYVVSTLAYTRFLRENNIPTKIKHILATTDTTRPESLLQASSLIKKEIMLGTVSDELVVEVFKAYKHLSGVLHDAIVLIKHSPLHDTHVHDSPSLHKSTYTSGESNLLLKIKELWAASFDPHALRQKHREHTSMLSPLAIIIQKTIAAEKSGILYTVDPITQQPKQMSIEAVFGLYENEAKEHSTPDYYELEKHTLLLTKKMINTQVNELLVLGPKKDLQPLPKKKQQEQKLTDKEILSLASLGKKVEHFFYFAQEVSWAIEKNSIYILSSKPITPVITENKEDIISTDVPQVITEGIPALPGIATGKVKICFQPKDLEHANAGDIIIVDTLDLKHISTYKKVKGIIVTKGGRKTFVHALPHIHGIPVIVGVESILFHVKNNELITVNGTKGEIYKGTPFHENGMRSIFTRTTATKLYVYINDSDQMQHDALTMDGIGMVEGKSLIKNIGIHPKKFIKDEKHDEFVSLLTKQLLSISQHIHPLPVVYKLNDMLSHEYKEMKHGHHFERPETHPLLGFHGAYRNIQDPHSLTLELKAIKQLREEYMLKNIWVMIPFVRSVSELVAIKKLITAAGLYRSPSFKMWMNVETPSNVINIDTFLKAGIDGVSIDVATLTTLLTGVDMRNDEVGITYNHHDQSVVWSIEKVVAAAHAREIPCSIIGDSSFYTSDMIQKLIEWGITSMTVPYSLRDIVREEIAIAEQRILSKELR